MVIISQKLHLGGRRTNRRLITMLFHSTLRRIIRRLRTRSKISCLAEEQSLSANIFCTRCVLAGAESATDTALMASDPVHFFSVQMDDLGIYLKTPRDTGHLAGRRATYSKDDLMSCQNKVQDGHAMRSWPLDRRSG